MTTLTYKMLFGFLILFTTGILVGGMSVENILSTINTITAAPLQKPTGSIISEHEPMPSTSSVSIMTQGHSSSEEKKVDTLLHKATSPTQGHTSSEKNGVVTILHKAIPAMQDKSPETEASIVQQIDKTVGQENISIVPQSFQATISKSQHPSIKNFGKSTQSSFSVSTPLGSIRPKTDIRKMTTASRDPPDVAQTQQPGSQTLVPFRETPKPGPSNPKTSEKNHVAIILVVVFSVLLVMVLVVFLYCRRRRHSGSTSFNAPQWAGQAALPDETGLDKDFDQEAGAEGEAPTRRGTLVTFFGKRQSRVPSVAMEDINAKGEREEMEQLIGGEASQGSIPERSSGDANGKIPEPPVEPSQESPTSTQPEESSS